MKIRIKFRKYGDMRFVGHLDLMRYFQRAMRRADIDLVYSEGFSPHPQMSFALPLGIGLTSEGEYLDMNVNTTRPSHDAVAALNAEMVDGVDITEYLPLPDTAKKAMASVCAADYFAAFRRREILTQAELLRVIREYFEDRDEIPVTKKTKKSERVLDLKPLIYEIKPRLYDGTFLVPVDDPALLDGCRRKGIFLRLSAGSRNNIRPDLVLEDLCRFLGMEYDPFDFQIHRIELYEETEDGLLPLSAAGLKRG